MLHLFLNISKLFSYCFYMWVLFTKILNINLFLVFPLLILKNYFFGKISNVNNFFLFQTQ